MHTEHHEHEKPAEHHGPEERANPRRSLSLQEEESRQEHDGHGHHVRGKHRRRDLEPLHRAEHRDRGRDHAVPEEQRSAEEPQEDEKPVGSPPLVAFWQQNGDECDDPALPVIVRPHDEDQVLERDDPDERPEDQREYAQHVLVADRNSVLAPETDADRVERTGSDVPEHHPHGQKRKHQETPVRRWPFLGAILGTVRLLGSRLLLFGL